MQMDSDGSESTSFSEQEKEEDTQGMNTHQKAEEKYDPTKVQDQT